MAKKIIGVAPLWDNKLESIWMLPGYMDAVAQAGAVPVILPLRSRAEDAAEALSLCDGLLLTGGDDIDPAMYGQTKSDRLGDLAPDRDRIEPALYHAARADGKPVLGICRGLQMINVLHGGTLYQDLPTELDGALAHVMSKPYDAAQHTVRLLPGTPLRELLGREVIGVNSLHHQAVRDLGHGLEVMAEAEDGVVEAAYDPKHDFVWAVQWHPELMAEDDPIRTRLFAAFVGAC